MSQKGNGGNKTSTTRVEDSTEGSVVVTIRESMIEEYVLELQKRKGWQSEMTRQIMNFLILQFLLKNIHPQDFSIVNGKIVDILLRSNESTETSSSWNRFLDSPLSDMKTTRPLTRNVKIPVIPMTKKDLGDLQFRPLPPVGDNTKSTISSYDLWSRYLEMNRGYHTTS
jgi:hypothetical protein